MAFAIAATGAAVAVASPLRVDFHTFASASDSGSVTRVKASKPIDDLDRALLGLLTTLPSEEELRRIKRAVEAYYKGDFDEGRRLASTIANKTARKLLRWYRLRSEDGAKSAREIYRFIAANPGWPTRRLRARAERMLLEQDTAPREVRALFKQFPPRSGAGRAALAIAYLRLGDKKRARQFARPAWRKFDLDADVEKIILARLDGLLTRSDHKYRLNRFLHADSRWRGTRRRRLAAARRVARLLRASERKKAQARIAVYARSRKARKLVADLSEREKRDAGVRFQRIQLLRRRAKHESAWKLLLATPATRKHMFSPDDWWIERRVNAYNALYRGRARIAYKIVDRHGPLTVNPFKEAEFMAGWIAFRHLKDPRLAIKHFVAMGEAADGPISRSTADYWLGRVYSSLGKSKTATAYYKRASKEFGTFYGQLARQALRPRGARMQIPPPPRPTSKDLERFANRDGVRALIIAGKADLAKVMRVFFGSLRYRLKEPGELVLLAHLAKALGDTQMALRIGKTGLSRGLNLGLFAYPTHAMPRYKPLRDPPERALLFALARQESEFNTLAISGAGAAGVLQVMPGTAKHMCRRLKLRCARLGRRRLSTRLRANPAFNAQLASAYMSGVLSQFTGAYIMAIAGYNAGPGNVKKWVKQNGDPRDPAVDPIDWIERIHIKETRLYVKKVMANLGVYRARLAKNSARLRLLQDLHRPGRIASSN